MFYAGGSFRSTAFLFIKRNAWQFHSNASDDIGNASVFFFAMYERNGMPLEVYLKHMINTKFIKQKERPYQTKNFYAVLAKQRKLEKEVKAIVKQGKTKGKTKALS